MKADLEQGEMSVCLDIAREISILFGGWRAQPKQESSVVLQTCVFAGLPCELLLFPVTVAMHLLAWELHEPRRSLHMLLTVFVVSVYLCPNLTLTLRLMGFC